MSDAENWSPRDLVEAIKAGDVRGIAEAGMMSYDDADYIADYWQKYKQYHGKTPVEDEDEKYARMVQRATTREFNRAVGSGNIARMAYGVGHNRDEGYDIEDWNEYEILKDLFREEPQYTDMTNDVFQSVIFSNQIPPTGRGKSSTMYTLSEIAKTVNPNMDVLSNNPSDEYGDVPEKWSDVVDWIRSDGWNLLLLDEAKQFLMYADQTAGKEVSQMMALLRHNKTHLILVAHTGAGIPADIRRQMFFVNKLSEKEAELGYGISEMPQDDRYQVANVKFKLDNIPHTDVDYVSQGEEAIQITFDDEDPEESADETQTPDPDASQIDFPDDVSTKTEKIKYLSEITGMKNNEIADLMDESEQTVSYHLSK